MRLNVLALLATVFLLLVVATASALLLRLVQPQRRLQDFFRRLLAWWIVSSVMLVVVVAPPPAGSLLFAVLMLLAARECWQALWPVQPQLLLLALPWLLLGLLPLLVLLQRDDPASLLLFCWVVLLTQLNDIAQYFAGKAMGRHRIAPRLSPNKTWEGFCGGVVGSMLLSLLFTPRLLALTWPAALGFGLLVGSGGFAGDLLFSWFKRRAGIKDFGRLLPGQGGVLDRLDSLTCTAPLCVIYVLVLTGA